MLLRPGPRWLAAVRPGQPAAALQLTGCAWLVAAVADFLTNPHVMAPSTSVTLFGGVLLFLGSTAAQDASEDSDVTEELVALMGARE